MDLCESYGMGSVFSLEASSLSIYASRFETFRVFGISIQSSLPGAHVAEFRFLSHSSSHGEGDWLSSRDFTTPAMFYDVSNRTYRYLSIYLPISATSLKTYSAFLLDS